MFCIVGIVRQLQGLGGLGFRGSGFRGLEVDIAWPAWFRPLFTAKASNLLQRAFGV